MAESIKKNAKFVFLAVAIILCLIGLTLSIILPNKDTKKYENLSVEIIEVDKVMDEAVVKISNNDSADFIVHDLKIVFKDSNNKELISSLLNSENAIKPNESMVVKVNLFGNSKKVKFVEFGK